MGIISRELEKGVVLLRDGQTLIVQSVEKIGRAITATVKSQKGIEHLTISDLWAQKVSLAEAHSKKKAVKGKTKPKAAALFDIDERKKAVSPSKKEDPAPIKKKKKKTADETSLVIKTKRAKGEATIGYGQEGEVLWTYWKRTR